MPPLPTIDPLPSERYEPGTLGPVGFLAVPSENHVARSQQALKTLGEFIAGLAQVPEEGFEITLCHSRFAPPLPANLFGFHVWEVGAEGVLLDPLRPGGEIRYALIVNQPVELQLEVALTFLLELAYRQTMQLELDENRILEIDAETATADERARTDIANRLRYGWQEAARAAVEAMNEFGRKLTVRYEADVITNKNLLDRRLPYLRRVYNELAPVRSMVDKTVSMVGGRSPSIRAAGGAESIRDWTQQRLLSLDVIQYFNHAIRDSEVCGNGYVAYLSEDPFAPHAVRPEDVEIRPDGSFRASDRRESAKVLTHFRGISQISSHYGISLLEPFIYIIHHIDIMAGIRSRAESALAHPQLPEADRRRFEGHIALADRMLESNRERLDQTLWFPTEHLPEARPHLYLPGHELY